jgi:hypothetical protein
LTKNVWATFWVIFSQTYLVTLFPVKCFQRMAENADITLERNFLINFVGTPVSLWLKLFFPTQMKARDGNRFARYSLVEHTKMGK